MNDTGKSTGNIPMEIIIISETHASTLGKQHLRLLICIHMPSGELANHVLAWVTYLITEEHTAIEYGKC